MTVPVEPVVVPWSVMPRGWFFCRWSSPPAPARWIASAGHQRVWPLVERALTTQKDYPGVLYDEV